MSYLEHFMNTPTIIKMIISKAPPPPIAPPNIAGKSEDGSKIFKHQFYIQVIMICKRALIAVLIHTWSETSTTNTFISSIIY
jgi:hypothetical protein